MLTIYLHHTRLTFKSASTPAHVDQHMIGTFEMNNVATKIPSFKTNVVNGMSNQITQDGNTSNKSSSVEVQK